MLGGGEEALTIILYPLKHPTSVLWHPRTLQPFQSLLAVDYSTYFEQFLVPMDYVILHFHMNLTLPTQPRHSQPYQSYHPA